MPTTLLFDLETNGLFPDVHTVHCLVLCDPSGDEEPEAYHDDPRFLPRNGSLRQGYDRLLDADVLTGHNIIEYDVPVLEQVAGLTISAHLEDTLVLSRLCFSDRKERDFIANKRGELDSKYIGQHGLAAWGQRLGSSKIEYKGGFDTFNQEMLTYCIQDVKLNRLLWRKLKEVSPGPEVDALENEFAEFCRDLNRDGVPFSRDRAHDLLGRLLCRRAELDDLLLGIFPPRKVKYAVNARTGKQTYRTDPETGEQRDYKLVPFNPNSRPQLAERLIEKGWVPQNFTPSGDPAMVEDVLMDLADQYDEAKLAMERYIVQARIGILEEGKGSYQHHLGPDGRVHGTIVHIGTVTHRCAHKNPNLGNPTSVRKPYGLELRGLFEAVPGYVFVGGDASGLELRMLGHYLARWDDGAYATVVDTGDPHTLHKDAINTGAKLTIDRNTAKTIGYAWLYGAGDRKLGSTVGMGPVVGKRIRNALRKKIEGLDPLLAILEDRVKNRGSIKGLDGRRIGIRHAHAALNTLLQSAGAIVMKYFPLELRKALEARGIRWRVDYIPHLHVHDEIQGSLRPHLKDEFKVAFEEAFSNTAARLNLRVPLRCEVKYGNNWAETH